MAVEQVTFNDIISYSGEHDNGCTITEDSIILSVQFLESFSTQLENGFALFEPYNVDNDPFGAHDVYSAQDYEDESGAYMLHTEELLSSQDLIGRVLPTSAFVTLNCGLYAKKINHQTTQFLNPTEYFLEIIVSWNDIEPGMAESITYRSQPYDNPTSIIESQEPVTLSKIHW